MDKQVFQGKTVDDALKQACAYFEVELSGLSYTVLSEGSKGFLGFGSKDASIEAEPISIEASVEEKCLQFLGPILQGMKVSPTVQVIEKDNGEILVDIKGSEVGILIGRRGETLHALQYLLSLALNRQMDEYHRVILDVENYQAKRQETLENLAHHLADKCRYKGRRVSLEPMIASERRIIHMALEGETDVETYSEGQEPFRRVVIVPKD